MEGNGAFRVTIRFVSNFGLYMRYTGLEWFRVGEGSLKAGFTLSRHNVECAVAVTLPVSRMIKTS